MSSPSERVRPPTLEDAIAPGERPKPADPMLDDKERADAPPTSRLGRLARLGALAPRALPMATEAVRRAMGGARDEEDERVSRERDPPERKEDR